MSEANSNSKLGIDEVPTSNNVGGAKKVLPVNSLASKIFDVLSKFIRAGQANTLMEAINTVLRAIIAFNEMPADCTTYRDRNGEVVVASDVRIFSAFEALVMPRSVTVTPDRIRESDFRDGVWYHGDGVKPSLADIDFANAVIASCVRIKDGSEHLVAINDIRKDVSISSVMDRLTADGFYHQSSNWTLPIKSKWGGYRTEFRSTSLDVGIDNFVRSLPNLLRGE